MLFDFLTNHSIILQYILTSSRTLARRVRSPLTMATLSAALSTTPTTTNTTTTTTTATTTTTTTAVLLSPDNAGLSDAGERLRAGRLVAFPTETVYGLGANALDEKAVKSIFITKGRPLTDPLIVHVPTRTEALNLLELDAEAKVVYELLATTFWPGPLTLVGKAISAIPLTVTAGTGFVGIRCPNHELARRLLVEARVPVAAPSANRFGHVSPTTAQHVYQDLGNHDIAIIDGENDISSVATCSIGIESTVAKVDGKAKKVILFRRGGVSEAAIRKILRDTDYTVEALNKQVPHDLSTVPHPNPKKGESDASNHQNGTNVAVAAVVTGQGEQAPGQCVTHYAPDVSTCMVHGFTDDGDANIEIFSQPLSSCVVVDFAGHLAMLESQVLNYRDLSKDGDVSEAAHNLFDTLRWTEGVEGAKHVLLVDVRQVDESSGGTTETLQNHEHLPAVADRMFRAASGRCVLIPSLVV